MTEHKEETITYGVGRFVIDIPAGLKFSGSYSMRTFDIEELFWQENGWIEQTTASWRNLIDKIRQTDPPKGQASSLIEEKEFFGIGKICKAAFFYKDPRRPNRGYFDLLASSETTGLWITSFGKATGKDFMYEKATDLARAYRPPSEHESRVAVLPDKDSFYLRYGAIDLPFEYEERVDIVFRGHPLDSGLSLELETNVVQEVYRTGLLQRFAAAIAANYAPGVNVEEVRAGKRTVVGLKGEELIVRGTEDGKTALNFQWDYPGRENDSHHPRIGFMMDSEDNRLEEKLALWDAILNSLRPAGRPQL